MHSGREPGGPEPNDHLAVRGDVQVHLEWSAPTRVRGSGQGRGNSGIFLMGNEVYRLKPSRRLYTSYASITPRAGYHLLATDIVQRDSGIMVRGERTLAFGLMPQLIEDQTQSVWKKIFVREIRNVAQNSKRLAN